MTQPQIVILFDELKTIGVLVSAKSLVARAIANTDAEKHGQKKLQSTKSEYCS